MDSRPSGLASKLLTMITILFKEFQSSQSHLCSELLCQSRVQHGASDPLNILCRQFIAIWDFPRAADKHESEMALRKILPDMSGSTRVRGSGPRTTSCRLTYDSSESEYREKSLKGIALGPRSIEMGFRCPLCELGNVDMTSLISTCPTVTLECSEGGEATTICHSCGKHCC